MLSKKFFLELPETTDPAFIFRILGEEQFCGNPPTLSMEGSGIRPDGNTHFCITLLAGNGFEWGPWTLTNVAKDSVRTAIEEAVKMYETSMINGFQTMDDVEAFLATARKSFEAC